MTSSLALAVVLLAGLSATPTRPNKCIEALRQQLAHDLHCPADQVFVWPAIDAPKDNFEAGGCGLRATFVVRAAPAEWENDAGCTWDRVTAPWVDPDQAKNTVWLNLGAGAPTGLVGLSYQRRLGSLFALEPGAGWGLSGVQLSFLLRVRNLPLIGAPGFGLSLAFGPGPGWLVGQKRNVILWLNADILGLEFRFRSGFALGIGAGIVVPIAGEFAVCRSSCTPVESQSFLYPALRISIGRWL